MTLNVKTTYKSLEHYLNLLPPVEQSTHTPIEIHEIFIKPNIENFTQNSNAKNNVPVIQSEESKLSLDNASPEDIPRLEHRLMSLPELIPEKIINLQKDDTFCNTIVHQIHCNIKENYFKDAMSILHKKVIDFNSTFSSVEVPKILIKYLLHASHDSLGHIGATKLYHFPKRLYYFQGMQKIIHRYVRTCQKCQIINLQKPNYINLHQGIAQTPQDHISIDLIGPYNTTS